jgi:hypothetical protein
MYRAAAAPAFHAAAPALVHRDRVWIAEHRAGLLGHVAQCWTRRAWMTAAQCAAGLHHGMGRRFATTVLAAAALMLLPALWL